MKKAPPPPPAFSGGRAVSFLLMRDKHDRINDNYGNAAILSDGGADFGGKA